MLLFLVSGKILYYVPRVAKCINVQVENIHVYVVYLKTNEADWKCETQ